jgi:hypothetical protein
MPTRYLEADLSVLPVEACFVTDLRFNRDSGPWRTVDVVRQIHDLRAVAGLDSTTS